MKCFNALHVLTSGFVVLFIILSCPKFYRFLEGLSIPNYLGSSSYYKLDPIKDRIVESCKTSHQNTVDLLKNGGIGSEVCRGSEIFYTANSPNVATLTCVNWNYDTTMTMTMTFSITESTGEIQ